MNLHDLAFWICAFFLLGVFLISILNNFLIVLIIVLLASLYLIFLKNYQQAILILLVIFGAGYYQVFGYFQEQINIPFDFKSEFTGIIVKLNQSAAKQEFVLKLQEPHSGKIKINSAPYPGFQYGDLVRVSGIVKKPFPESLNYFKKEGISGILSFPKIEFLESGRGNAVKSALLNLKMRIIGVFKENLPAQKAAFLAGITLGERQEFSKEFDEKLSLSGTTHIVALSGYNISVIGMTMAFIFGSWFSRSATFYLSSSMIVLFVLMTGAEASIVRAAIMGVILLLAEETERIFSVRNAIVIAAFLMALSNPRLLVFDLGFQLSFMALLGLVYLLPVLKKIFKMEDPGFWKWKENSLTTISAQLAVAPFLLGNFGIFSLTSLFANILILSAIPITMGLGFLMGGLGLFSQYLAQIIALAVNFLLFYELLVIDIFSKITLPIATESFGFFAATVYYALLIGFIRRFNKL